MKIGIISDTHDDIENVQKAIEIFNVERVQYVIHAGDYIFPGIVKEFEKLNSKLIGVLGNNDGEKVHLLKNFLDIGGDLKGELAEIELDGLRFGVYMEHLKKLKNNLLITANIIFSYVDILIGENYLMMPPKENMKMIIKRH